MQIIESQEKLSAYYRNIAFPEGPRFQLFNLVKPQSQKKCAPDFTKSKQEPPPKYSMTIHNLYPRKKLVLYCVTKGLEHVLRTDISC